MMLNWFCLCGCIHACLCMCFLRSSHSLWGELVHQVLSEGSGRDWKADGPRANGSSVHIIRLVYGHGLDLLSSGGDHWPSSTAGCQAGAFNSVWRVCRSHIEQVRWTIHVHFRQGRQYLSPLGLILLAKMQNLHMYITGPNFGHTYLFLLWQFSTF